MAPTYAVRLCRLVDGKEAEPGYIKKIRPNEDTVFKGWICEGKDVLEFLFARTPIEDDDARAASSSSSPSSTPPPFHHRPPPPSPSPVRCAR